MNISLELVSLAAVNVIALIVAYVKTMAKVAHVEGQLIHFVRQIDKVDDVARDVDLLDRAQIKTAMDVDHAFEKIRALQETCAFTDETA